MTGDGVRDGLKRWFSTVVAGGALGLALLVAPTARPGARPSLLPSWTTLRYEAENALGRIGGEIALRAQPEAPDTWVAEVRTWFEPLLLWDKGSQMRVWFDPRDGSVAHSTKRTTGPRPDKKIYRYTDGGAHRVRIEPRSTERELEPEHWSQVRESFYGFQNDDHGCEVLSDPAAILARISVVAAAESGAAPEEQMCVFLGKTFYRVGFRPGGVERVRVNYRILSKGEKRKGKTRARRVLVHVWPVAGELDQEAFDLVILVEEGSGLPVAIRTPVAGFGEMDVSLVGATLL
jgi:hypothetical protein